MDQISTVPSAPDGAGAQVFEAAKQPAVAAFGEAGEVVGAFMDLLHEGGFGVDEACRAQDAVDLGGNPGGVEDVLEDGLNPDGVDGLVGQGDGVGVGHELGEGGGVDVEGDGLQVGVGDELVDAHTLFAAADDQQDGIGWEEGQQAPSVGGGDGVFAIGQAADFVAEAGAAADGAAAAGVAERGRVDDAVGEVDERGLVGDDGEAQGAGAAGGEAARRVPGQGATTGRATEGGAEAGLV